MKGGHSFSSAIKLHSVLIKGLPCFVLNDPGRLHTALVAGWAGSIPSNVETRYVRYTSFRNNGWNINPGIWSYEGVAGAHIVFSGLSFLALGSINIL